MSIITAETSPKSERDSTEMIPAESPLAPYVSVNRERMHGEPCFRGSRVPIQTLFDYLSSGDTIDEFLEGFAPVSREQALGILELAATGLLQALRLH